MVSRWGLDYENRISTYLNIKRMRLENEMAKRTQAISAYLDAECPALQHYPTLESKCMALYMSTDVHTFFTTEMATVDKFLHFLHQPSAFTFRNNKNGGSSSSGYSSGDNNNNNDNNTDNDPGSGHDDGTLMLPHQQHENLLSSADALELIRKCQEKFGLRAPRYQTLLEWQSYNRVDYLEVVDNIDSSSDHTAAAAAAGGDGIDSSGVYDVSSDADVVMAGKMGPESRGCASGLFRRSWHNPYLLTHWL